MSEKKIVREGYISLIQQEGGCADDSIDICSSPSYKNAKTVERLSKVLKDGFNVVPNFKMTKKVRITIEEI